MPPQSHSGAALMGKTSINIDGCLVEQAKALLGTQSIKETINAALQEIVRMDARRQEVRALSRMDGLDLADAKIMAKAWFANPPHANSAGSSSRQRPRGRSRGRRTGP